MLVGGGFVQILVSTIVETSTVSGFNPRDTAPNPQDRRCKFAIISFFEGFNMERRFKRPLVWSRPTALFLLLAVQGFQCQADDDGNCTVEGPDGPVTAPCSTEIPPEYQNQTGGGSLGASGSPEEF